MKREKVKVFKYDDLETKTKIKYLIHYATKCNYEISFSHYETLEDIIKDANHVRFYGNEPSARRAIRLINKDVKIKTSFKLVMSDEVRQHLQEQEELYKSIQLTLKVKREPITLVFE